MPPNLVAVLTQKSHFGSAGYTPRDLLSQRQGCLFDAFSKMDVAFYTFAGSV